MPEPTPRDRWTALEEAARDSLRWDQPDPVKMDPQAVLDLIRDARERERLRAWIDEHGTHAYPGCSLGCNCGLAAALAPREAAS